MLPFWGGKCLPLRFIRVTRLRTETNRPLGGCLMGYIHRNPWSIHSFNYVCVEHSTNNVVSIYMCVYVCKCNRVWEYFSWQPHPKLIPPTISPTSPLLPPLLFDTISFWLNDWTCHGQSRTHESSQAHAYCLSMDKISFLFDFWIFKTLSNILCHISLMCWRFKPSTLSHAQFLLFRFSHPPS